MFALLGPSTKAAARGTIFPLMRRGFATTSAQVIKSLKDLHHQSGFKLSEKLKQELVTELKESAKRDASNSFNCNCLPFKGAKHHEYMMDDVFEHLMEWRKKTNS